MQEDLLALALDWHRAGRRVAIATVVETWGSAPRQAGSLLIVDDAGIMAGSVSGGCVEGAVVEEAHEALRRGDSKLLEFGVADETAFAVGLACGGRIRILVDSLGGSFPIAVLEALVAARASRQTVALVAGLSDGIRQVATPDTAPALFDIPQAAVRDDALIVVHHPPLRMIIVGAVHIAQALVPMAGACGYDVTVVDPRGAFGNAARFGDTPLIEEWPDEALALLAPDHRTAVVTLTHDSKLDDPAIMAALRTQVFYLGCLGSKRTHEKRVARLQDAGFDAADIARIHAPVGLNIGAKTPPEIAVSIMAQVTQVLRGQG